MTQEAGLKNKLKSLILWANLTLTLLLTAFSIYGAFIGAEAAQAFFNSIPLSIYWAALTALLVGAIVVLPRLLHIRGLFLAHTGCVLVLAGAICGSQAGFKMWDSLAGTDTIRGGQMIIPEGTTDTAVDTDIEKGIVKTLPFAIKLVDFRLEYYQPGELIIRTQNGEGFKIPAQEGQKYVLDNDLGSVEIVRRFENFKLTHEGDKRVAIDDPNSGTPGNPALELLLKKPDGSQATRYAFERFPGHSNPDDNLTFSYRRTIRDFLSDVEVVKDNKVITEKSIEVNKPLHYGGYLFYQQGYDSEAGRYTVLRVTNDRGLGVVYLGYILLCAGVFWHLWFRHMLGDREIED